VSITLTILDHEAKKIMKEKMKLGHKARSSFLLFSL
jgi:hypothetical protein